MAAGNNRKSPHVLAIPFPKEEHLTPFLNLSYLLASRGLSITLLTTQLKPPYLHHFFARAETAGLEIRPLDIPLPSSPDIPPSDIPEKSFPLLAYAFRLLEDPIEQWLEHGTTDNPVTCIISDFYLGWTQTLSVKTKIPRIVFRASSAFGACVDNSLWSHLPHLAVKSDAEPFQVPDLPVEISLRRMQISRSARMFQKFDPLSEFLRENRLLNMQSWGTIVNTFYDLESVYITQLHETTGKPVWAVGPLIMQPLLLDEQTLGVQRWLDLQQAGSVLCVSLGEFGPEQMAELAWGLEGLDRPFVWFLNKGNETIDRFRERVGHRGLIITNGSAPPGLVFLSHPSVGGFMTRGDWNSTVASIAIGVPMITWPTEGDEFLNSMLVLELLQIGVRVCQGEEVFLPRDELKTAVEQILGGGEEAKRAREFGDLARNVMKEEGSSIQSVKAFVDEIHKLASTPELPP